MKNTFFLTPELSPIFGKKDDDLMETLSIITRVLDGHGYESDSGAHGHRGYSEDIMFTWVGAAVDIPWKVHKYLGTRGAKLYFFRLPLVEKSDDEYMDQMTNDDFNIKAQKIQAALIDYLNTFDLCPNGIKQYNLTKIPWDNEKDDSKILRIILKLAKLLAHLRAVVTTWETDDSQGWDYSFGFATVEDPSRAMTQLRNLARGHALSQGRNYITMEDMPILIKTVFSTASLERVRVFELLLEFGGKLSTSQIVQSLNTSNNTAKRTMSEFRAIGLVDGREVETQHGGSPEKQIILVDKLEWFLSQEFKDLVNSECKKNPPCVPVYQNQTYASSILLKSILPRTDIHKGIFSYTGIEAKNLIKLEGIQQGDKISYDIQPTVGDLSVQNNFIGGHLRMRAEGGGRYPTNYLEFIDMVFGPEPNTVEVCSNKIAGLNKGGSCYTVDINPEHEPDLVADGQVLEGISHNIFDRWRCDPPYNDKTAKEMYNTELPNSSKLLKAGSRVVKPNSLLFLLHSNHGPAKIAELVRIGYITISTVPNNETRILNIYVKLA